MSPSGQIWLFSDSVSLFGAVQLVRIARCVFVGAAFVGADEPPSVIVIVCEPPPLVFTAGGTSYGGTTAAAVLALELLGVVN